MGERRVQGGLQGRGVAADLGEEQPALQGRQEGQGQPVGRGPPRGAARAAPGPTRTAGVLVEWGESIEEIAKGLPMGRTARPAEIAEAILFLASPRSSYVTGATLAAQGDRLRGAAVGRDGVATP
ncbi:SDR family oxidoreductase [Sphaerisporangium sp. NBC_01403]|uniref:SDR family oxidoreductase n=1 Tax=Sphaerisporangium sp. NBC_01403 TaxID=2903599 RepID=UPI003253551D